MTELGGRVRPGEAAPLIHAQVARAASDARLRVLAIKGPALAVQELRTPRDTADVDVLVHPDELGPLVAELRKAGWRESLATTAPSIMARHSVSVLNDHWPISIDLHHYFPGFLADPGKVFDVLWARHEDVPLAGVPVPACDRVAHVALVALHHLREQRATAPLHPELVELRNRARSMLSAAELDELVEVARELGAVATLRSFLVSLGVPRDDLDEPAPEEELALWNLRVNAPDSYPWLLHLRRTPLRRWPRAIWRAIMLTEDEILTFHGDDQGTSSVARLRWRRLRRGLRSVPEAVLSRAKAAALKGVRGGVDPGLTEWPGRARQSLEPSAPTTSVGDRGVSWALGGDAVLLSPPDVGELEQQYVLGALQSGWVAPAGPDLSAFESEVAARADAAFAVALSSGTAALHLTLVSWDVGPGDVVPMSTFTFAATANAVRYVGAEPHFVDCDPRTGNMSPALLEEALGSLEAAGRRVPVVIPVDMLGKCVDHDGIGRVAATAGARILSDAAESFGASYRGKPAGSFGDASVLSFNGNKIMTTSGGGMLLTSDEKLAAHVRKLSTQAREPVAHYEHTEIGYNYRLSNVLAALGRAQLVRLDDMMARRRVWRERYRTLFAGQPGVVLLGGDDDAHDNCWLTAVLVDPAVSAWTVDELTATLSSHGVETRPMWKPMHQQPVFAGAAATLDGSADRLFRDGLTLPSGSGMSEASFSLVEELVAKVTRAEGAP